MAAGVDFDAFISTESDSYRKPGTKMWEVMMKGTTIDLKFFHIIESAENNEIVSLENSFYVGDAAGRAAGWESGRKKDFASTDRCVNLIYSSCFYIVCLEYRGQILYPRRIFSKKSY